ncbi:XVIPCD domain-containing protein [uncultured Stenotrophomonas sp.]|uniref:XVIPCD domain-containing protein n=1 Tax=uncultured Stenotrophomonas sp. TaxID=165438 RepID=UPI0025F541C6|nr:XVIPCD domain-containing protein [uncultured Stenotrophomonas sp.]
MSSYRTHFQEHHSIEQQTLKRSELLYELQRVGKLDIHAPENRLFLPASPQFAQAMGITPHSGGPLAEYQKGILGHLNDLQVTRDGKAALLGDPDALDRMAQRIERLRDTVKVGLINGDLNTNTPVGSSPALTSQKVQDFFRNAPAYYQAHTQQIERLKGFTGVDHGWGATVHSEARIVTALHQIHIDARPLTRGGNIELQRSGLSLAIANAHHEGRVTMSPAAIVVVERSLGEEAAYRIRVPREQQGFATMGILLGDASASTLVRSGGLLASGADAVITTRRAAELLEQGNAAAAQSEVNHALARNAGGWLGGTTSAYLVGTSSFAPAALVVADALLMSKAFEKGADLLDNRAIYHQIDTSGVEWQFSGRNWQRQAPIDRTPDGVDNPTTSPVGAGYEKARELGAYASRAAVEQALGKAPAPLDPFSIPARPSDQHGLDNQNWRRDPQTEQWQRQVKAGLAGVNDQGIYATQVATPERARELNQEALSRIERNIAQGQEALAAAYLESYAAQRSQDFIAVPAAVESARAKPNAVRGSDNQLYLRDDAGQWTHAGRTASGNLALELELTQQIRQPSLQRSAQALAEIEARPAPTQSQAERNELLHRYQTVGTQLNPEWQQAIVLATARTREAHGITGATLQELRPGATGTLGADSPIIHYQVGPDGIAQPVATTTTDELRQAWNEIRAQRQDPAPIPDSPELRIAALSPRERDAYQQSLQEANRLGVSGPQTQQVAASTVAQVPDEPVEERLTPQVMIDAHGEDQGSRTPNVTVQVQEHRTAVTAAPMVPEPAEPPRKPVHGEEPRPEPVASSSPPSVDASAEREARAAATVSAIHTPSAPSQTQPMGVAGAQVERPEPLQSGWVQTPQPSSDIPALLETAPSIPAAVPTHPDQAVHRQVHQRVEELLEQAPPSSPTQPGHPDHALYQQVRVGVAALDAKHGRSFDAVSERMTASLLVLAKDNDLDRVDHVLLSNATANRPAGHTLFVVQGEPSNPAHRRAAMPTEQAAQTLVEASMQQFDVVSQQANQRALANQLEQQLDDQRVQHDVQIRVASRGM